MNIIITITIPALVLLMSQVIADMTSLDHYRTLSLLQGEWKLSPAAQQEGGATKKGPAKKMLNSKKTAMSFKVIGKGSTVQENLLPGTSKEMATMYHCNKFNDCSQIKATHYCAKQNQPELVIDYRQSSPTTIVMNCGENSALCNSVEDHVHNIKHELSQDNNHLKTSYISFINGKYAKTSIYHFDRK